MSKQLSALFLVAACAVNARAAPPSLAWNLRPAMPVNVVRIDTAVGMFNDPADRGSTTTSLLSVSYKLAENLAPLVRVGVTYSDPSTGPRAAAISNPLLGLVWAPHAALPVKLAVFAALALPVGSGGGDGGEPARATAAKAGVLARSAMDNALFAVNDLTPILGVDATYVRGPLTVQGEATLFELIRVRGETVQPDAYKTNVTTGVHAGYQLLRALGASAELRYQRFLSTPVMVEANPPIRDNLSVAVGLRAFIPLANRRVLRPGISYARTLDEPNASRSYQVVQLDLPFVF